MNAAMGEKDFKVDTTVVGSDTSIDGYPKDVKTEEKALQLAQEAEEWLIANGQPGSQYLVKVYAGRPWAKRVQYKIGDSSQRRVTEFTRPYRNIYSHAWFGSGVTW